MTLRHVGTLVLASSLAVCAPASAIAGNGNGNDNGNSANAPGQVKKEEATAAAVQTAPAVAASASVQPAGADAEQTGVKPSNDTAHDTRTAAASDRTKEYGNGKTAGQIAMQNGAAPTTTLHGPGNSQPHKASPCAGGHEVDVHALKAKRKRSCGSSEPTPTPHPTTPIPDPGPKPKSSVPPNSSTPTPSTPATSGGGGVTPTPASHQGHKSAAKVGVLASPGAVAGATTLPFTGLDLWSAVFVGVLLILIGLALCRRAATVPVYKSDEEGRP
jgi:hypothetical protein